MKDELDDIDVALGLLRALRAEVAAERAAFEGKRLTRQNYLHPAQLDATLAQIDNGLYPQEGTDPRLWALVNRPEVARFRLRAPGLATLERLRARITAEREAAARTAAEQWPQAFRLRPGAKFFVGEQDVQPGDVLQLTRAQASAFGDLFERV